MTQHNEELDLSGVPCPANSARALIKLETMTAGEILKITVDDGEPRRNVPPSLEQAGHAVLETARTAGGQWVMLVKKV